MNHTNPIFIVGYMHSGTTLLQNILRQSSYLFSSTGETKFFDSYTILRHMYPDLKNDAALKDLILCTANIVHGKQSLISTDSWKHTCVQPVRLSEREYELIMRRLRGKRTYGAVFSTVFDYYACINGKSYWLEKTPSHIYHINEIITSVPAARFIEIVRDPRDVIASKKTRRLTVWTTGRYTQSQRPVKHLEKAYDPLWDTLAWKSAIGAGRNAADRFTGRIFNVRYEDLVRDPVQNVRDICEFLELPFEPKMVDVTYRNAADWNQNDPNDVGITDSSVGRWQRILMPSEVALCQWIVCSELRNLNYQIMPVSLINQLQLPLIFFRSVFEFVHRLYHKWRLGGSNYIFNILINYWRRLLIIVDN